MAVLYAKDAKEAEDPKAFLEEKEAEYNKLFTNPYQAAKYGYIDDVIEAAQHTFPCHSRVGPVADQEIIEPREEAWEYSIVIR